MSSFGQSGGVPVRCLKDASLPTVTLSGGALLNVRTNPLPQAVNLTWTSTNATDCDASSSGSGVSWNQIGIGTLGTKTITVPSGTGMNMNYTVKCTGPGGATTGLPVNISTVCYPKSCTLQSCVEGGSASYGVADASTCDAASTCSTDSDCTPRSPNPGGWREISPQN